MSVVERYNQRGCSFLNEPDGRWVKYTDYAALLERLESIRETNAALVRGRCQMDDEIAALQAKLDAVTKDAAGLRVALNEACTHMVGYISLCKMTGYDMLIPPIVAAADRIDAALTDQGRAGDGRSDG